ncbi:flippase-like domain-containing protein [Candidatus Uhrbacteria bacterium]|nr:flippase-like domain-containing protein [Candidatus Uhrbacteria bacterium]
MGARIFNSHFLRNAIFLSVIGAGIYYFIKKGPDFARLLDISFYNISIATAVIFISYIVYGLRLKQLFSHFIALEGKEWFGFPMIVGAGNQFLFKAGTVTLAVYLKNRHQLPFIRFLAVMTVDKILHIYGLNIFGLWIAWRLYNADIMPFHMVLAFAIALSISTFILYFNSVRIASGDIRILNFISKALDSWHHYKKDVGNQIRLIGYHVLYMIAWAFRFYVAFYILNHPISLVQGMAMAFVAFFAGLLTPIPGSLGVREAAVGFSMTLLGNNFDHGVFATVLDRILATFWSSLLAVVFFQVLHLKNYPREMGPLQNGKG